MTHTIRTYLVLAALVGACALTAWGCHGHNLPDIDCDAVDPPAFADVSLFANCRGCHSTTLDAASRNGAPLGIDYDTYEAAVENAEHGAASVYEGTMPPGGIAVDEDKQNFYAWALCGQPQ